MNIFDRESGQAVDEFALLLVFMTIVVIAVLVLMGPSIGVTFQNIIDTINAIGS